MSGYTATLNIIWKTLEERAKRAEERAERAERALCELTPGGSEYAGDVSACVRYVRDARDSQAQAIRKFKAERDAMIERCAKALAVMKQWGIDKIVDKGPGFNSSVRNGAIADIWRALKGEAK